MKFIDEAIIELKAGHGGPGCVAFRRETFVPRGGPAGGQGGRGGHVIFVATKQMSTLLDFRYKNHFEAKDGQGGMGSGRDGHAAEDLVIPVPVGTVIYDDNTEEVLADMLLEGQECVAAKGGRGGQGNAFFATSTNQTPRFAQPGEEGEVCRVRLELKLLADVGLIGLPNAGKSTLLASVSAARPKIADYPFTTLTPHLGVVQYANAEPFVIADLPGLIEGAHQGKGRGDKFLKHAERTRVLLHLVSVSPDELQDPLERYDLIEAEVQAYFKAHKEQAVAKQKKIVVLTKIDLLSTAEVKDLEAQFKKHTKAQVIPLSSVSHKNTTVLLQQIIKELSGILAV